MSGGSHQPSSAINHTVGIVSEATATALQTDAYLKDHFIDVTVETIVRPDLTYTGTYLLGRENYLEIFPEGALGFPLGYSGLSVSDEVTGGIQATQQAWQTAFGADQVSPIQIISQEVDGVAVPWFYGVAPLWAALSGHASPSLWAMEYVPAAGSTSPPTRREYLAPYYDPTKLAQNVQALVFGLPDGDRDHLRKSLEAVGWRAATVEDGFVAVSPRDAGTRRLVYAVPAMPGREGLLCVVWRLNRLAFHTEPLGDAVLKVGVLGLPYAMLWFVPPELAQERIATQALGAALAP